MLTTLQKAAILQKTGIAVPDAPAPSPETSEHVQGAMKRWAAAVEALFAGYVAARAAKSLREAEEGRQLQWLRQLSAAPARRTGFASPTF